MFLINPFLFVSGGGGGGTGGYNVSGPADAAGFYAEDGLYDGKMSYKVGSLYIWWFSSGGWFISSAKGDTGSALYFISSSDATPPLSGWSVAGGTGPAPTLTAA